MSELTKIAKAVEACAKALERQAVVMESDFDDSSHEENSTSTNSTTSQLVFDFGEELEKILDSGVDQMLQAHLLRELIKATKTYGPDCSISHEDDA